MQKTTANNHPDLRRIKKTFTRQNGNHTCGVACLVSIIKYHGGDVSQQQLQNLSGTTLQGTTLLGLYQAAQENGLDAEGYENATVGDLAAMPYPVILHVVKDNATEHYIVCYGHADGYFTIGDPAWGVTRYSTEELNSIWKSQVLLSLIPNGSFVIKQKTLAKKWEWIKQLAQKDMPILSVAAFLGLVTSVLGLAIAVFSQKLIDVLLPSGNINKLIVSIIVLIALLLIRSVLSYMRSVFLLRQGKTFNNRIIAFFFDKLLVMPKAFFDSYNTGEMIARMKDTQRIQKSLVFVTGSLLIEFLTVVISLLFLFYYSPVVGLICLASVPLYVALSSANNRKIIDKQRELMETHAKLENLYINTIQGISAVKSGSYEQWFNMLAKRMYNFYQDNIYGVGILGTNIGFWSQLIALVMFASVITLCSIMVLNGELTVGRMMAIISVSGSIVPAVGSLSLANIQLQEARVAFDRMYEFASGEPEYKQADHATSQDWQLDSLEVKNLSFRFPGRKLLLNDLSFVLERGEMIALFGEIGCGKSTLLNIVQRFYGYDCGEIVVNRQKNMLDIDVCEWRKHISTVEQHPHLFSGTLASNIKIGLKEDRDFLDVIDFCKKEGFDRFFESFQQGYLTIVGENGVNLSGGQQQLILLARALYEKPQLLLLDEPTSAMDRQSEQFVLNLLKKHQKDMAILLVTHRIQLAKHAGRIFVLNDGMITARGCHDELILHDNLYSRSLLDITE